MPAHLTLLFVHSTDCDPECLDVVSIWIVPPDLASQEVSPFSKPEFRTWLFELSGVERFVGLGVGMFVGKDCRDDDV